MNPQHFDYVVIGAGASGSVVAGRLAADGARRVLLIEAGQDIPPHAVPRSVSNPFPVSYGVASYTWRGLTAAVGPDRGAGRGRFTRPYFQGRIVGGGSSINGMFAQRALPSDFDEWVAAGAHGWSWDEVLPHYLRFERDLDFDGPLHGQDGPIPIRRQQENQWSGFAHGFVAALESQGLPYYADVHSNHGEGVSAVAMNNTVDRRVSAADGFLDRAARERGNLTIVADSVAERVLFDGRKATGVRVQTPSGVVDFSGDEIVLCCGAVHSPALLMRSGIGDAQALRDLGIETVEDLPGVGRNLQNHAGFHLATYLARGSAQSADVQAAGQALVRFSSNNDDCPPMDMYAFAVARSAWHPLGRRIGALSFCVQKPFSKGTVELVSPEAAIMPRVDFNLLSDPRDFARMVQGVEFCLRLLASPLLSQHLQEVFIPNGGQANALNQPSALNWSKAWIASRLFELGPTVRRSLLGDSIVNPSSLAGNRLEVERLVREHAAGVHHPCGTCKMGTEEDAEAVLDSQCRVRGLTGLRVADASVMPSIVRAGTHLTALMIGEKVASMLVDKRQSATKG
ncbi:GMC family oxidoreductase [Ottowia thiooxydans]|uniref:5-(Hydroxymethyl)furfural/furfural oxidase n=1 Tax=Ottowia thiooxydans TaxID=219182 RepID=A0ABV2QFH0_9BURK